MLASWMIAMEKGSASGYGGKRTRVDLEESTETGFELPSLALNEKEEFTFAEDEHGDVFDFEDVEVAPADGMLIKHSDDEVRLLFFYVMPTLRTSKGRSVYKAVTELRIPRRAFLLMADDIRQAAAGLQGSHPDASLPIYM